MENCDLKEKASSGQRVALSKSFPLHNDINAHVTCTTHGGWLILRENCTSKTLELDCQQVLKTQWDYVEFVCKKSNTSMNQEFWCDVQIEQKGGKSVEFLVLSENSESSFSEDKSLATFRELPYEVEICTLLDKDNRWRLFVKKLGIQEQDLHNIKGSLTHHILNALKTMTVADCDRNLKVLQEFLEEIDPELAHAFKHKLKATKPEGTLNVIPINAQSCKLKWDLSCDGDSTVIRYIIEQRDSTQTEWTTVSDKIPPDVTWYNVENLKLSTEYYFRVCAENAVGRSEYLESRGTTITFDLSSGIKIMYRGRAMVLGASGAGKTSTVKSIFDEPFEEELERTDGIDTFRFDIDSDWSKIEVFFVLCCRGGKHRSTAFAGGSEFPVTTVTDVDKQRILAGALASTPSFEVESVRPLETEPVQSAETLSVPTQPEWIAQSQAPLPSFTGTSQDDQLSHGEEMAYKA
ncbi:uncharacterized protein LOC144341648 [Saccoglossus kowalevskii]